MLFQVPGPFLSPVCMCLFGCVLSRYTVALTLVHTHTNKQDGYIPLGKNWSVLDDLMLSLGSRKIVVWGIWCAGVRGFLHGMGKMWHEKDVMMLTLSNDTVTPSVPSARAITARERGCETESMRKGEKASRQDGVQLQESCIFHAVKKVENMCLLLWWVQRVFHFMPH